MKVFVGLAAFAKSSFDGYVLTTEGKIPLYALEEGELSLDVAKKWLYNLLGISREWSIQLTQSGTYEFLPGDDGQIEHIIIITYMAYFPAVPIIKYFDEDGEEILD